MAGPKAAWLLNTYASAVGTGVQAAALQIAIWESLYDNDHNLNTGNFSLVTSNAAYTGAAEASLIYGQANTYLNGLFSASAPNHQYLHVGRHLAGRRRSARWPGSDHDSRAHDVRVTGFRRAVPRRVVAAQAHHQFGE